MMTRTVLCADLQGVPPASKTWQGSGRLVPPDAPALPFVPPAAPPAPAAVAPLAPAVLAGPPAAAPPAPPALSIAPELPPCVLLAPALVLPAALLVAPAGEPLAEPAWALGAAALPSLPGDEYEPQAMMGRAAPASEMRTNRAFSWPMIFIARSPIRRATRVGSMRKQ